MKKHFLFNKKCIVAILLCYMTMNNTIAICTEQEAQTQERWSTKENFQEFLRQKLEQYMESRFILSIDDKEHTQAIRAGIQQYIQSKGAWPTDLNVKEQFYFNVGKECLSSVQRLFSNTKKIKWSAFKNILPNNYDLNIVKYYFNIYLAYPIQEERAEFFNFCKTYVPDGRSLVNVQGMFNLLPIFQAYPTQESRAEFINFCMFYLGNDNWNDIKKMCDLLPIFQVFPSEESRVEFFDFCKPYLGSVDDTIRTKTMNQLFDIFQTFPKKEMRTEFINFCKSYLCYLGELYYVNTMTRLILFFKSLPTKQKRAEFLDFCKPYFQNVDKIKNMGIMTNLLPIFQILPTKESRTDFFHFCESYWIEIEKEPWQYPDGINEDIARQSIPPGFLFSIFESLSARKKKTYWDKIDSSIKTNLMKIFLPIFQAFPSKESRDDFIIFSKPFLSEVDDSNKPHRMMFALPIFQAFPTLKDRIAFFKFYESFRHDVHESDKLNLMINLLPIFQDLSIKEEQQKFLAFYNDIDEEKQYKNSIKYIHRALYKYMLKDETFTNIYKRYMKFHKKYHYANSRLIFTYMSREYLCFVRSFSTLETEINPTQRKIQSTYEISIDNQLPIIWIADPFLAQARGVRQIADAHFFDSIYPDEFELLMNETNKKGYYENQGKNVYTRYNKNEITHDFHTNTEVEDFIQYLDTEFLSESSFIKIDGTNYNTMQIVSLVKQMLGIEPKATNVSGVFSPYLGSSIFYAKSNSPKGDEMLGRTWYLVKKLGQEEIDKKNESGDDHEIEKAISNAKDLKRSVVIAVLEAAEISQEGADTHCQTRMTGELLKAICLHLEGSQLRGHIISENTNPEDDDNTEIIARIESAPQKAQQLFNAIYAGDVSALRILWAQHINECTEPELFEIYLAYYDALYQRTVVSDIDGKREYKKDEHILMRDDHGNLVNFYNADGTEREAPHIVYYQAEFQVLEYTFTQLMRQEFEDQRSVKY